MKVLARSHAAGQPKSGSGGIDPVASGVPRIAVAARHSSRNMPTIIDFAIKKENQFCGVAIRIIGHFTTSLGRLCQTVDRVQPRTRVSFRGLMPASRRAAMVFCVERATFRAQKGSHRAAGDNGDGSDATAKWPVMVWHLGSRLRSASGWCHYRQQVWLR
jgi:hypothetical protein